MLTFFERILVKVSMKIKDSCFNSFQELDNISLMEINGGECLPFLDPSVWWTVVSPIVNAAYIILSNAAVAYVNYSAETGGKYVIHHAQ